MFDIVFIDIPYISYEKDNELEKQMNIYHSECDDIIQKKTGIDASEKQYFYSMGILCLSSFLKKHFNHINVGYIHYYINFSQFEEYVKNARVLAFSTMTVTFKKIISLVYYAYSINPDIKIILGGYHATFFAHDILQTYDTIDCVFLREGEQSLLKYMLNLDKDLIQGIAFRRENGEIAINGIKEYLKDEDIPCPDYSLIEEYFPLFNIQLSTMRGCIGSCSFCVNSSYWSLPRYIPIQNIINELVYLKQHLKKGTVIHIIDNIFTINNQRLSELYDGMKENNLLGYFHFECDTFCKCVNIDNIRLLKDIGIFKICLGIEDCEDSVLKTAKKGASYLENITAAKLIRKEAPDICIYAYWILGLPGSSSEGLNNNIFQMQQLIEDNIVDIISPKIFIPYPGTYFYNNAKSFGIEITSYDWDLYERRNPPFPYHYDNLTESELYQYLIRAFQICHNAYMKKFALDAKKEEPDGKLGL